MSGLVKRTLGFNAPVAIKLQLYSYHVRSLLEYFTPLWSPYQVNEIISVMLLNLFLMDIHLMSHTKIDV